MGNILLLKNADFSKNAVSLDNLYDLVKQTDQPSVAYPLTNHWNVNNVPLTKDITVYAVEFAFPSDVTKLDAAKKSAVFVGASDFSTVLRHVEIDTTAIKQKILNGEIEAGSTHIVALDQPFKMYAGEYFAVCPGDSSVTYDRSVVYCRTPSGNYGNSSQIGGGLSNYNLACNLYGVEDE